MLFPCGAAAGDAGTAAETAFHPAFGAQRGVGGDDGGAAERQSFGEFALRGKLGAREQDALANGFGDSGCQATVQRTGAARPRPKLLYEEIYVHQTNHMAGGS